MEVFTDVQNDQQDFNKKMDNRMSEGERHFVEQIDTIKKEHGTFKAYVGGRIQAQEGINWHFQRGIQSNQQQLSDFEGRQMGFNRALAQQAAENDRKQIAYHNAKNPCTIQ